MRDFRADAKGATAITFGLGLTTMLLAMGAGIDFAMAAKKQAQAQDLADSMGLAAAVYVKNHPIGSPPENDKDGLQNGKTYKVSEIDGISTLDEEEMESLEPGDDTTIRVDYKSDEAIVTVKGSMPTTFMALAGIEKTDYEAQSVIKYHQTGIKASSVMMVLDNSGSMNLLDRPSTRKSNGGWKLPKVKQKRIDGLVNATKAMMDELEKVTVGVVTEDYIRTGMLPFEAVVTDEAVPMGWGTIADPKITAMSAGGYTNTAPPMNEAIDAMDDEDVAHGTKGNLDPLKYVIFMTDGVNTATWPSWKPKDGTTLFRRKECYRESYEWREKTYYYNTCPWRYGIGTGGNTPDVTPDENRVFVGASQWEEGELRSETDYETLRGCETLKASGTQIYAIGFATEPGTYHMKNTNNKDAIDEIDSHRILSFMQECSSGPGYFMKADDSEALKTVFEAIGKSIWEKSIYVSR